MPREEGARGGFEERIGLVRPTDCRLDEVSEGTARKRALPYSAATASAAVTMRANSPLRLESVMAWMASAAVRVAIRTDAVEGPGRVAHQAGVEAEIARHPRRGLDAMIGGGAADHQRPDTGRAQPAFQIGADEGAVDSLDDHRLARDLARLVLDRKAGAIGKERRIRRACPGDGCGRSAPAWPETPPAIRRSAATASGLLRRLPAASHWSNARCTSMTIRAVRDDGAPVIGDAYSWVDLSPALTASRNCLASACSSFHPIVPFRSTSGRNSQKVSP